MTEQKTEFTKIALATLLATVVTGASAWLAFGQDKVTRDEMRWYSENQSPWTRDKGEVMSQVKTSQTMGSRLETTVDKLAAQVSELVAEQRVLNEKISRLLNEQRK